MDRLIASAALACTSTLLASAASAQWTERVNVSSSGAQAAFSNDYTARPAVSADGRFVAFHSPAANLVSGDTNNRFDVFVRDRLTSTTTRVSVASDGTQSDGDASFPFLSADGRFVAFQAYASTLVPGVGGSVSRVFVHDRETGTTELGSWSTTNTLPTHHCHEGSLSADGRWLAFSGAGASGEPDNFLRVYVRDRQLGTTVLLSPTLPGTIADGHSYGSRISADGRFVSFSGWGSTLVAGDTNEEPDVFVADRMLGTVELVSSTPSGASGNQWSGTVTSISGDGRYVAFPSRATDLVPDDTNDRTDTFVRDRATGETTRVSVATDGIQAGADSLRGEISADGRYVAFETLADNLGDPELNGGIDWDVYLRDRLLGTTIRVSVSTGGAEGNEDSQFPAISADGRYVGFASDASNLVAGDSNSAQDVFLRDRQAAGFAALCSPGLAGVIVCPCGNAPSGPGRGCDNSAATGGAVLTAFGIAYLASDTLRFRASGETATATSILLQGSLEVTSGAAFGQGVRCVGGTLLRLYVDTAVGGGVIVPDAGDPSVSARSAALGDPLAPGATRYYLMYYRDPVVLGGCPAASTFNATETGSVTWWP